MGDTRLDIYVPTSKVSTYRSIGLNEAFWIYQDYMINWGLMAEDLYNMQMRRTKKERVPINTQYIEKYASDLNLMMMGIYGKVLLLVMISRKKKWLHLSNIFLYFQRYNHTPLNFHHMTKAYIDKQNCLC